MKCIKRRIRWMRTTVSSELFEKCLALTGYCYKQKDTDDNDRIKEGCFNPAAVADIRDFLAFNEGNQNFLTEAANFKDAENQMCLHIFVCGNPPPDLMKRLIKLAPDTLIAQHISNGWTPLHVACFSGASCDIIRMLVEARPKSAELKDKVGRLPLHIACGCEYSASPNVLKLLLKAYPKAAEIQDNCGSLPLHITCEKEDSSYCLEAVKLLLEAYKEAAKIQDRNGNIPIQRLLDFNNFTDYNPSADVVKVLLEAYPEAAKISFHHGELLLNQACLDGAPLDVLDALLVAYPESIHATDIYGEHPSNCLKFHRDINYGGYGGGYMFLLHKAAINGCSVSLVNLLIQAFPESGTMQDDYGMVPLHYACLKSAADISMDIIMVLADDFPESCHITNKRGKTPFQLLKESASYIDNNGMVLLHHLAATSKDFTTQVLTFLLGSVPDSVAMADNRRMLPFHYACLNSSSSIDLLMLFLQFYPGCIASYP